MCGIVGGVAQRNIVPILLDGLKRLEYRGYDSAGLAVINGGLQRVRSVGHVSSLAEKVQTSDIHGEVGIAHTRWATHGASEERNAHPHVSSGSVAVVHNGIIENHSVLRAMLEQHGYVFESDTDTEVIAHLIHLHQDEAGDTVQAILQAMGFLKGSYAIGVVSATDPGRLICASHGSPLVLGVGIEEHFFASDAAALFHVTQSVTFLEDGDLADLSTEGFRIYNAQGGEVEREMRVIQVLPESGLGKFRHYMQKEIFEQPYVIGETIEGVCAHGRASPDFFGENARHIFDEIKSVRIVACGSSFHAGLVGQHWIEKLAGIPCNVEIASEYRYSERVPDMSTLVVAISQSGETADTLGALAYARALGHHNALAICNVGESALVRQTGLRFITQAGTEIGVASTKAFICQLVALFILAVSLGRHKGRLSADGEQGCLGELKGLPVTISQVLEMEAHIIGWAKKLCEFPHALFLGRGIYYPIAMEGALKLKEISYIHAEAYPAGELKHGPLALVDHEMPVVVLAPTGPMLDKLKSNVEEVLARGGNVFVLTDKLSGEWKGKVEIVTLDQEPGYLAPVLYTVLLQLLAYHTALLKGTDVDKPRNLAKSVTVE